MLMAWIRRNSDIFLRGQHNAMSYISVIWMMMKYRDDNLVRYCIGQLTTMMAIIDMQIITCIIWLKSLDLLFYIIIIVSLHFFLVLTCVILSLYRSKRRPPDSEWGGHWEHSQPWKILIINIALLSLLLLLSLSLLLKMNCKDTRGIVGKSVWNSTCRSLEEKVAPIIFVIFKTAHI